MSKTTKQSFVLLEELAREVCLQEGSAGVERFVWALARSGGATTTRQLSQQLGIPVPVVAALRRELEKRGYLSRGKGMRLSADGQDLARQLWGAAPPQLEECSKCHGSGIVDPAADTDLLSKIERLCRQRPSPDVRLDQALLEPGCLLLKARLLISHGCVLGRNVLFLGDDDFLSLGVLIVAQEHGVELTSFQVAVLDLDTRVTETIQTEAKDLGLSVAVHSRDARDPLPESLKGRADSVITDPPYTLAALDTFLERAGEALQGSSHGMVALSFGRKSDAEQLKVQSILSAHRLALRKLYPAFNRYLGAAVLGGVSDLYLLGYVAGATSPAQTVSMPFYTVEGRHGTRSYLCLACRHRVDVGPNERFATIGVLKESGCPECGNRRFRYAGS